VRKEEKGKKGKKKGCLCVAKVVLAGGGAGRVGGGENVFAGEWILQEDHR